MPRNKNLISIWLGDILKSEIDKQYGKELKEDKLVKYGTFVKRLIVRGIKKMTCKECKHCTEVEAKTDYAFDTEFRKIKISTVDYCKKYEDLCDEIYPCQIEEE